MKIVKSIPHLIKTSLIAGALVVIPIILTFWVLKFIITSMDSFITSLFPESLNPETLIGHDIPGFGLVSTLILLVVVGIFTRLYIVRKLVRLGDWVISKLPVGRGIYSVFKKFLATILSQDSTRFKQAVLIDYPRMGCKAIAFLTGDAPPSIQTRTEKKMVGVFVPTTPNPTSGFYIILPEEDIIRLPISIERAFQLIISGGIISDDRT
ncbi:MAG: DUF502 domain-containing protein [Pseudomonadota bacterium]